MEAAVHTTFTEPSYAFVPTPVGVDGAAGGGGGGGGGGVVLEPPPDPPPQALSHSAASNASPVRLNRACVTTSTLPPATNARGAESVV